MKKTHFEQKISGESGFNLIGVLIGVALTSLVVMFASRAFVASKQAKLSVKAGDGYQQVTAVLNDSLKTFVKTQILNSTVPCGDPAAFFATQGFLRLYNGNHSTARSQVPAEINGAAWAALFNADLAANSFAGSSLNRCSRLEVGNNGRFHFCVNITRDLNQSKESLLRSPLVFAEVVVQLSDLQTGNTISCANYLEPNRSSAGANVDYVLFWVYENGSQLNLKKRSGSLYVNK
ncbi:MAG: hypothetical protein M3Q07_26240 [Pseudobdellovibrionaceae bacterium]|nr:hypothetical protein [Pseudobdellovibrionaceae bacterium]